jgi:hypothetical protein
VRDPVLISAVIAIPGGKLTRLFVDLHPRAVERHARRVDRLLASEPLGSLLLTSVATLLPEAKA